MSDRRYDILKEKFGEFPLVIEEDSCGNIFNAMDEYFSERALELLEYVWNKVQRLTYNSVGFITKEGEVLSKEQLFENFL